MSEVPRIARWLLRSTDWAWSLHTGYTTPFLEEIAKSYGLGNTFKLLGTMMASTKRLEQAYGATGAQLALGLAGAWNGCRFCGAGHVYAANLLHFREHDELLPLDERDIFQLQALSFESLANAVRRRFTEADGEARALTPLVDRFLEIELGATPRDDDGDKAIVSAIETWNHLNECSIETVYDFDVQVIPALATVGKDKKLIARYQAARGRS